MAQARQRFLKVQRGAAATWGTGVAATAILAGLTAVRWRANETIERVQKLDGTLAQADSADRLATLSEIQLSGYACPSDLPYILESAYKPATPTSDSGTPPAYTRVYAPTLTVEDTPQLATLEVGGNTNAYRVASAVVRNFTLSGSVRGRWEMQATWWGTELTATTFTPSLNQRSYERMLVQKTKLYIDDATGTMGGTLVTQCWLGFEFQSGDCYVPRYCISDRVDPEGFSQADQQPQLQVRFQQGPFLDTLLADARAGKQKYIRLLVQGAQIHGGATPAYSTIQIDMAAHITEWPQIGDREEEGALVVPVTFSGTLDKTGSFGKLVQITVINSLATLP